MDHQTRREVGIALSWTRNAAHEAGPWTELESELRRQTVVSRLTALPDEYRTILRLSIVEGMSYGQIASHLGRKRGWVTSAEHAARATFLRNLAGDPSFEM